MKTAQQIISYLYLVAAILLTYEGVQHWDSKSGRSYLIISLAVMAVLMFFVKRYLIKKNGKYRK